MKLFISILCVCVFWQNSFCQNGGTLKIRKLKYDTLFYTQEFKDTTTTFVDNNFSPLETSVLTNETWYRNILFTKDSLYVFTQLISKQKRKLATKKTAKFWRKINRKKKKGKLAVYSTWYNFNQNDTRYNIEITTKTFCKVRELGTSKVVFDEKLTIDSTISFSKKTQTNYAYLSGVDTIILNSKIFNINTICRNSSDYSSCLFSRLIGSIKEQYNQSNPFGHFKMSSKLFKNSYEMYFDFENYLVKKFILTENQKIKYYCDFKIDNDSIYILNCPVSVLRKGKISRKYNRMKFRNQSKNYSFYLKDKNNIYDTNGESMFGNRQYGHYVLKLAQ